MTAEYPQGDAPLIPMPALSLPALRQAVATVARYGFMPNGWPAVWAVVREYGPAVGREAAVVR